MSVECRFFFFFFNDTATTEIYTLSLHDALPICSALASGSRARRSRVTSSTARQAVLPALESRSMRSEEHTSELQSLAYLVCRLLLEKKKTIQTLHITSRQVDYTRRRLSPSVGAR